MVVVSLQTAFGLHYLVTWTSLSSCLGKNAVRLTQAAWKKETHVALVKLVLDAYYVPCVRTNIWML